MKSRNQKEKEGAVRGKHAANDNRQQLAMKGGRKLRNANIHIQNTLEPRAFCSRANSPQTHTSEAYEDLAPCQSWFLLRKLDPKRKATSGSWLSQCSSRESQECRPLVPTPEDP